MLYFATSRVIMSATPPKEADRDADGISSEDRAGGRARRKQGALFF
jgi:hypothetical protein